MSTTNTTEYATIMRRVGLTLIMVGAMDIAVMIYCIANKQSYSSSFNVFAVVAGIFLWRGNLHAVSFVTAAAIFFLSAAAAFLLLFLLLVPPGLIVAYFRQSPGLSWLYLLLAPAVIALLYWVYRQLRKPAVLQKLTAGGQSAAVPKKPFIAGGAIPVILVAAMYLATHSDAGTAAVAHARDQLGPDYRYWLTSLRNQNGHVAATVVAYNKNELRSVRVEW